MPDFSVVEATALLARTPSTLDAQLRGLPTIWLHASEGEQTFSPVGIMSHLVNIERTDWLPRLRIILDYGESKPFDPVDRFAQQDRNTSLEQLLDDFARLRAENLATLRSLNLQPADLIRRGTHPVFGPVTLSQLLATWTVHDLTHLHQLTRVLAHQYREAVGPWRAYLGVLRCQGHSAA